jgi:hypothetical protein
MKDHVRFYIVFCISVVAFLGTIMVNQTIYYGVWPSTLPAVLLVTNILFFRTDSKSKLNGWRYCLFILILLTVFYFSLPKFTYNQAKEIVSEKYEILYKSDQRVVAVAGTGYSPFALAYYYHFDVKAENKELRVMVNPKTGSIVLED